MKVSRLMCVLMGMAASYAVTACSDQLGTETVMPGDGAGNPQAGATAAINCTATVTTGALSCRVPDPLGTGPAPMFDIVGGQGIYVQLTSSNVTYTAATQTFQADVTIENLLPDAIGTPDGSTVTGIRVFFHDAPTVTSGTGPVTVSNADGTGTFTGTAQPYFQYDELLNSGETSAARTWTWSVPTTALQFTFSVYVHADRSSLMSSTLPFLALGDVQTCALLTTNDVQCWGDNWNGVFGNGTITPSTVPVAGATGLRLRSLSLAVLGADWACGVSLPGDLYCWGSNTYGVLGSGAGAYETTPQLVASAMGFVSVDAGEKHACALTATGDSYCWGDNFWGNLGDGTTTARTTPTPVLTPFSFTDIQAGSGMTCGLATSGNVYCWGSNLWGQLGDGTTTERSLPDSVSGDLRYTSLSVGSYHACAVAPDGRPYCWGSNSSGELGVGDANNRDVPTLVVGSLVVTSLSAGYDHTCAVDQAGAGWCWGQGSDGQLGTGDFNSTTAPAAVLGGLQWKSITAQEEHTCGLTTGNQVYCWGRNSDGQLGDGTTTASNVPVQVTVP